MKNILVFIFATSLFLFSFNNDFAIAHENSETKITFENVNPNNSFRYNFKRIGEKLNLIRLNMFNKDAIGDFMANLAGKRERELIYIVESEDINYIETVSSRYITTVGNLSEIFDFKKVTSETILEALAKHPEQLADARDHYPANSAQWLMLQQAEETAKVLISKVQEGESE